MRRIQQEKAENVSRLYFIRFAFDHGSEVTPMIDAAALELIQEKTPMS
jgi:hypothetical protein